MTNANKIFAAQQAQAAAAAAWQDLMDAHMNKEDDLTIKVREGRYAQASQASQAERSAMYGLKD